MVPVIGWLSIEASELLCHTFLERQHLFIPVDAT
jgi:hypothetical protein